METLKCKECGIEKTLDLFYKHPEGFKGVLGRCKDCIRKGRTSDREMKMSRIRDRNRYYNDPKRRKYIIRTSIERRIRKGYAKVHRSVDNFIKRKYGRPNMCSVCKGIVDDINILRIVFHHPNYEKPYEGVFCCDICHSKIHLGKITDFKIINLCVDGE